MHKVNNDYRVRSDQIQYVTTVPSEHEGWCEREALFKLSTVRNPE